MRRIQGHNNERRHRHYCCHSFIVRYLRNRDTVPDRTNPPNGSQYFWVLAGLFRPHHTFKLGTYSAAQPSRILEWLYLGVLAACSVFYFPLFLRVSAYC